MLSWWRRCKERQQQLIRDADKLDGAVRRAGLFRIAGRERSLRMNRDGTGGTDWSVRREIARRIGKEIGLETATRYLSRLRSQGSPATLMQQLRYGVWSQMAPNMVRDTLFRIELALRESLISRCRRRGVGFCIQTYVRSLQYEKSSTVTIVVDLIVLMIEAGNS